MKSNINQIWKPIEKLDAEIRTIEEPTENDNIYLVEVGLFESTGESAGDILYLHFKGYPTEEEIIEDIKNHLKETKRELQNKYLNALSCREEIQLKIIKELA